MQDIRKLDRNTVLLHMQKTVFLKFFKVFENSQLSLVRKIRYFEQVLLWTNKLFETCFFGFEIGLYSDDNSEASFKV